MENNYSCIIIDDEPLAIEGLIDRLAIVNKDIEVIGTYTTWSQALEVLRSKKCDLLFLDISIQGRNGMDLLRGIPDIQSEIIFVTAHADYAVHAFNFPASGYILKPINDIDLATAVDRATKRISYKKLAAKNTVNSNSSARIGIPSSKAINYVNTHDIIYLEAHNTYTSIVTKTEAMTCAYNIGRFKDILDGDEFYQVHRSFIVNLDHVRSYSMAGSLVMDNAKEIPVSKSSRESFMKLFKRIKIDNSRK